MNTTFIIDGGLGRQIAAIPALEKFVKKFPETHIITHFWTPIFWGNPILSKNIFDVNTKGLFEKIKNSKIIKPEPYYNNNYISNKISLADAFNEEINGDNEKMPVPNIYLTDIELKRAKLMVRDPKNLNKKLVCIQPFGSAAVFDSTNNEMYDNTIRSLPKEASIILIDALKNEGHDLLLFDDREISFIDRNKFLNMRGLDCRVWAALIANCDYFVGCDSAGQHIARCFNVPGTVFMGGTTDINTSYPGYFNIIKKGEPRSYMGYRLADFDYWLAELENSDLMKYTREEIINITKNILQEIKKTGKAK